MPKKSSRKKSVGRSQLTDKQKKLEAEMFEDLDLDDTNHPRYLKGKLVAVFGLLMVLFLTLYLVFAPIQHVVFGEFISQSIEQNKLTLGDVSIYFPDDVAKELSFIYQSEQESRRVESSVCLRGFFDSGTYSIDEIFYPLITYQTYTEVSFKACPDDTLIMLHTHPANNCEASRVDRMTLRKRQYMNENVLMIIMCADNRYAIYT
jgi:hypothetical protein